MTPAPVRLRPTRAEIDLDAIEQNTRRVRAEVGVDVWGVIKADAYGHGAVPVAQALSRAGASGVCVALVEEGLELRRAGVTLPVLVMSGVYREGLEEAVVAGLTPVIYDASQLETLASLEAPARVHLKIDTGMSRLGVLPRALPDVAKKLRAMPHVTVDGVMTHFADADLDDPSFTTEQLARFEGARATLAREGVAPRVVHAANSAAAFRVPSSRFDFVRTGIVLYGVAPFPHDGPALMPAFRLCTQITALREVPAGTKVGYAGTFTTMRSSVIATVPIGYADGFFRRLSSDAEVLVHGHRARVVGNVSMDMATLDVTTLAARGTVAVGDEVVLLGAQRGKHGSDTIRAEEIAARLDTIAYEVLCAISRRVPRVHLRAQHEA